MDVETRFIASLHHAYQRRDKSRILRPKKGPNILNISAPQMVFHLPEYVLIDS
jgi:hypothetical protein